MGLFKNQVEASYNTNKLTKKNIYIEWQQKAAKKMQKKGSKSIKAEQWLEVQG